MGQYYRAVNLSKRQFIQPWTFGDGAGGLMTALAVLLADGNNRGGDRILGKNRMQLAKTLEGSA